MLGDTATTERLFEKPRALETEAAEPEDMTFESKIFCTATIAAILLFPTMKGCYEKVLPEVHAEVKVENPVVYAPASVYATR